MTHNSIITSLTFQDEESVSFPTYLVLLARVVVLHVNPLPTLAGEDFAADVAEDLAAAARR